MQKKLKRSKGIKAFVVGCLLILFSSFFISSILLKPRRIQAQAIPFGPQMVVQLPGPVTFWEKVQDALKKAWKSGADVAFQAALKNYLNKLAYQAAVSIASGGKGQKPLVELQPGKLLKETVDKAAGDYLDKLGTKWGVDLCNLPAPIKVRLELYARKAKEPPDLTAKCKASDIYKNITLLPSQKLVDFSKNFNLEASEMGAFLKISAFGEEEARKSEEAKRLEKELEGAYKSLTATITGAVKTPASTIGKVFDTTFETSLRLPFTYTGSPLADAVGTFSSTLGSKLLERIMKKGLVSETASPNELAGGGGGAAAAKATFASLAKLEFGAGGSIDVLNDLSSCSSYQPGQFNCVIDDKFRIAIEQKLTVKEALNQGFLDGTKTFGYDLNGVEPDFRNGYPYRSLVILRKYRVIPVGWELAAKYLKQFGGGNVTLKILTQEYNNSSSPFYKLVDPDWVLKAPESYCNRQGAGEEILSETYIDDDGNPATPIVKQVQRKDVCVDEKSCIAENDDGSCKQFGTCIEEKPIWRFKGDSCPAYYNTCQTFKDPSGNNVSYLKNTLDYNNCSADNAGCLWYCQDQNSAGNWTCTENTGHKLYFDNGVEKCSADNVGCHEYLRIASGTNLVPNSSFESPASGLPDGWLGGVWAQDEQFRWSSGQGEVVTTTTEQAYFGSQSLKTIGVGRCNRPDNIYAGVGSPEITGLPAGAPITVSFWTIQADNPDCTDTIPAEEAWGPYLYLEEFYNNAWNTTLQKGPFTSQPKSLAGTNWHQITAQHTLNSATTKLRVYLLNNDPATISYLDGISLQLGAGADYQDYGSQNQVYLKKAATCVETEVGCKKYTPTNGGDFVPGVVSAADFCPAEMSGCQAYQELALENSPPNLDLADRRVTRSISLIPSTAKVCSASEVGCEEYTNLDEVAQGGEGKEYYSSIRQCVKSDAPDVTTYYTWVGDDQTGYQLKAYHLVKDTGNGGPKYVTGVDPNLCTEAIFATGSEPDCTQFYNANGDVYYRLKTKTITASDDCHPLRNTLDNETYYAIPSEARSCSAGKVGCRAYKGPAGDNIREVLSDNFEDGDTVGWGGDSAISTESVYASGHSMNLKGDGTTRYVRYDVSDFSKGKPYLLSYWAKGPGQLAAWITQYSSGLPESGLSFDSQVLGNDWQAYKLGPIVFNRPPADHDYLYFSFAQNLFIDNIKLQEVTDNLYLIKDSYQLCAGNEGCQGYRDDDGNTFYLKSFTRLCSEEKVGCEQMIDTQNSSSPFETTVNGVTTPADSLVTIVNNKDKYCQAEQKGCELFGQPTLDKDGQPASYTTAALKNDPDRYSQSLCSANETLCKEYQVGNSASKAYFKDPSNKTCEYRKPVGGTEYKWYKKKTDQAASDEECPVSVSSAESQLQSNFIENGEFDIETQMTFWNQTNCGSAGCGNRETGISGDSERNSSIFYLTGNSGGDHAGVYQRVSLKPGEHYTLSLWAKVTGGPPAPSGLDLAYAYAEWRGASGDWHGPLAQRVSGEQVHGWQRYQLDFTFDDPPADNKVTIYPVVMHGTGQVLADDVRLTSGWVGTCEEKSSGCNEYLDPQGEENLVSNNSFEGDLTDWTPRSDPNRTDTIVTASANVHDGSKALEIEGKTPGNHTGVFQTVSLKPDKWYTLGLWAKVTGVDPSAGVNFIISYADVEWQEIPRDDTTWHFDKAGFEIGTATTNHDWKHYQINFFFENPGPSKTVTIYPITIEGVGTVYIDDVKLAPTNAYYYLSQSVDQTSCNGAYDPREGCLLFNDTTNSSLNYSSYSSEPGRTSSDCSQWPQTCDSNTVIKVERDRVCAKWLYCKSSVESPQANGEIKNLCTSFGVCNGLGEAGQCNRFDFDPQAKTNITGKTTNYSLDDLKNMSGSVVAGLEWSSDKKIEGDYPVSAMEESGLDGVSLDINKPASQAALDFESKTGTCSTTTTAKCGATEECPSGETCSVSSAPAGWQSVSGATLSVKEDDDKSAINGNNYLEIAASQSSAGARLWLNQALNIGEKYALSLRLKSSVPNKNISFYLSSTEGDNKIGDISPTAINDWKAYVLDPVTITKAKDKDNAYLTITASDALTFGIDDLSFKPVLEIQSPNTKVSQSCRMYPKSDSLSCNYTDSNGVIYQGWNGYCLEKDPKNPNYCLNWWPSDLVSGQSDIFGQNQTAGYTGRSPLYYCLQTKQYEWRQQYMAACTTGPEHVSCPVGYTKIVDKTPKDATCPARSWSNDPDRVRCDPIGGPGWYPYNGSLERDERLGERCESLVQATQGDTDQAWAQRIASNSYTIPVLNYTKTTDLDPYGGTSPLEVDPISLDSGSLCGDNLPNCWGYDKDPSRWSQNHCRLLASGADAGSCNGNQPLYVISDTGKTRAGSPYSHLGEAITTGVDRLKRLFTKIYGSWSWGAGVCSGTSSVKLCASGAKIGSSCSNDNDCNKKPGYCTTGVCQNSSACSNPNSVCIQTATQDSGVWVWQCWDKSLGYWQTPTEYCTDEVAKCPLRDKADIVCAYGDNGGRYCSASDPGNCKTGLCQDGYCLNPLTSGTSEVCSSDQYCYDHAQASTLCVTAVCVGEGQSGSCTVPGSGSECQGASGGTCVDYTGQCVGDGSLCSTSTGKKPDGTSCPNGCVNKVCHGGDHNLESCTIDANCQTGTPNTYSPITSISWPTPTECSSGTRSADDYCYLKPKVENIKIGTTGSGDVHLAGGGEITLKFNTKADPEQEPLKQIQVDWGDGKIDTQNYPYASRQDPAKPHVFYHRYRGVGASAVPQIQIQDNWGAESGWIPFNGRIIF